MAKYVVVEFDNNEEADAFVSTLQGDAASMRVVGVYQKPTKFCECADPGDRSTLGQKYNWYVHAACGRPKKLVWQKPRNMMKPEEVLSQRKVLLSVQEPRP